ncbi:monocarboxylate transporter 12-B-like, partial [Anoplopoma fimbria]|uniref:monocarboxylate transporter 12-B-like n=1 Tax=Anoplopoma fimbria TaxID=229290 RepID=UPI0023EDFFA1
MVDGKRRSGVVSPPDGGWGWVIVGCCFMVTVCTRAVTRCISIFFVEFQAHFGGDYAATAWIHSLVDCTTMLFAPVGSLVGNRWSCRVAVMLGGLLSSCGLLLSSFTTSLELLYLTMGVLTVSLSPLAPAVQLLIELYSWRGALLILSAFVANMCVCGALLRPIRLRECEEEAEGEEGLRERTR